MKAFSVVLLILGVALSISAEEIEDVKELRCYECSGVGCDDEYKPSSKHLLAFNSTCNMDPAKLRTRKRDVGKVKPACFKSKHLGMVSRGCQLTTKKENNCNVQGAQRSETHRCVCFGGKCNSTSALTPMVFGVICISSLTLLFARLKLGIQ